MAIERTLRDFDTATLAAAIPAKDLLTLQIIHVAMPVGVLMLSATIGLLAMNGGSGGSADVLRVLTFVALGLAVAMWIASNFLWKLLLKPAELGAPSTDPVGAAMVRIRSAWLVRLAPREGAALFGLVVLVVAATGGLLPLAPALVWLAALPALSFLGFCATTVPTRERLAQALLAELGPPG